MIAGCLFDCGVAPPDCATNINSALSVQFTFKMRLFGLRHLLRSGSLIDFMLLMILVCLCLVLANRWMDTEQGVTRVALDQPKASHEHDQHQRRVHPEEQHNYSGIKKPRRSGQQTHKQKVDKLIDERVQNIPDTRSEACTSARYKTHSTVSIIIVFFDYQFFDLKTTMASILDRTNHSSIEEIVLVDDGTTLEYIKEDAQALVEQHQPWMKMVRSEYRRGLSAGRLEGAHVATSDVLVFLDTYTVVNTGWLSPLIHIIESDKSTVAVPHFDSIQDPVTYHYRSTSSSFVNSISWTLSHSVVANPAYNSITDDDTGGEMPIISPAVRPNAFAINAAFFRAIGQLSLMKDAPAEMLEFSLRAWLCGGTIKAAPCSRVGVLNMWDYLKPYNTDSLRAIVDIWMPQHHAVMCQSLKLDCSSDQEPDIVHELRSRISDLQLQCESFSHYLQDIASWLPWPDPSSERFGLLRVESGRCLKVAPDSRVDLIDCSTPIDTNSYPSTMMFELDEDGSIQVDDRCLTLARSAYIIAADCTNNNDAQLWSLSETGLLVCEHSNTCAMHVTDPEKNVREGRQIIMGQACEKIKEDVKKFVQWKMLLK